jgi:dTDP-L-rhamnose 4-epimerase
MMGTVLITGGAGFIGSHLVRHLGGKGYQLRLLDSLSPQIHGEIPQGMEWLTGPRIEFKRGSIVSREDIETSLQDATQIVHLAAETGTGQSMYEIARYTETNVQGTALLLDALANARHRTVKRIVLASSRAVYGEGAYVCDVCDGGSTRVFPVSRGAEQLQLGRWELSCSRCGGSLRAVATKECDPARPASVYAATKYAQEQLVRVACDALGIDYVILRLQNVYGEGQSLRNPYTGILSIFSSRIRRGVELAAFEDGLETRDFIHVADVVEVIARCLSHDEPIRRTMNVGTGQPTSILQVATELSGVMGGGVKVRITGQFRIGDIRHNYADVQTLRELLGYQAAISLEDGLRRFSRWVLTQPLPADQLERANSELLSRRLMG